MTNNAVVDAVGGLPASVVIAWIAGIVALLGIAWVIGKRIYKAVEVYRKKRNAIEEEHETFENMQSKDVEIEKAIADLKTYISEQIAEIKEQNEENRDGLKFLTGDMLEHELTNCISIGYIPADRFKYIENMFDCYANRLKGNGYIHDLYNKVIKLPLR